MSKRKSAWRIWAKALGTKEGKNNQEADLIAGIRTVVFISYLITNVFIMSGVMRHWNSPDTEKGPCGPSPSPRTTEGSYLV